MATVDSLVLELGVKSSDLTSGLDRAASAIDAFASRLEGIGKLLDSVTGNAAPLGDAVSAGMETAERSAKSLSNEVVAVGNKAQVAANKMNSAFSNSASVLSKLKGVIAGVFGAKLLSDVAKKGASLDRFQKQTGLDSTRADAWGKATERAGGSADAMRQALKDWTDKGYSEDEFYRLGEQMKGMNARQRSRYLRIRGVNEQAGAAFVEYGDQADKVASQYKSTAITPEQQKMARDFVESFKDLKIYIDAIATRVAGVVLPIATNIFKRTKAFLDTLLKDGKTIEKLVMTIGAAFALKWVMGLAKSVMAMTKMVKLMKGATTLQKLFNVLSMANPIGLIVAALAVAVALIDDFVAFLKGGDSIIGDMVKWFSELAPKIAAAFGEFFVKAKDGFFKFVEELVGSLSESFSKAIDSIVSYFGNMESEIADAFEIICDGIYDSFIDFVTSVADPIIEAFTGAFDAVVEYFTGVTDEIGDALSTAFDGAFDSICDVFRNIYAFIVDTVIAPVEKFIGGLGDKLKAVKSFFGFGDKDKQEEKADAQKVATKEVVEAPTSKKADDIDELSYLPKGTLKYKQALARKKEREAQNDSRVEKRPVEASPKAPVVEANVELPKQPDVPKTAEQKQSLVIENEPPQVQVESGNDGVVLENIFSLLTDFVHTYTPESLKQEKPLESPKIDLGLDNVWERLAGNNDVGVAQDNLYRAMIPTGVEKSENPTAQNIVSNNSNVTKTITNENTTNVNYDVTVNGAKDAQGFQEATKNLANNSARALSKTYSIALSGNMGK